MPCSKQDNQKISKISNRVHTQQTLRLEMCPKHILKSNYLAHGHYILEFLLLFFNLCGKEHCSDLSSVNSHNLPVEFNLKCARGYNSCGNTETLHSAYCHCINTIFHFSILQFAWHGTDVGRKSLS